MMGDDNGYDYYAGWWWWMIVVHDDDWSGRQRMKVEDGWW